MGKRRTGYVLWLIAVGLLWFFENNTGTAVVLATSVLIPTFSLCCAGQAAKGIRIRTEVPERCVAGGTITVICRAEENGVHVGYTLNVSLSVRNRMTDETLLTETVTVGRDGNGALRIPVRVEHCGRIECAVSSATVTDWLGLWEWPIGHSTPANGIVLPNLTPVRVHPNLWNEIRNEGMTPIGKTTGKDENTGIRAYVPGDPVRMIHWKLTEKLDKVMLRETSEYIEAPVLLLLETKRTPEVTGTDIHRTVEAFLTVATSMATEGMNYHAALRDEAGELVRVRIDDMTETESLTEIAVSTVFGENAVSIGKQYFQQYPEENPRQIFVFGTTSSVDAVSFCRGRKITLVLPESQGMTGGTAELAVLAAEEFIPEIR